MAQYITVIRLLDNKSFQFKSNSFSSECFNFEEFTEIAGKDILKEIKKYSYDDKYQQSVYDMLLAFVNSENMYMFSYK